MEDLFICL